MIRGDSATVACDMPTAKLAPPAWTSGPSFLVKMHKALKMTPALAANVSSTLWSMDDLALGGCARRGEAPPEAGAEAEGAECPRGGMTMDRTRLITKVVGPVLLLRAVSILIDRQHFLDMLRGLDREVATISFSLFPIAFLMACIALAALHTDWSSPAAVLVRIMAWGGAIKAGALIVAPHAVAAKAQLVGPVFLNVVLLASLAVGGYFTWFGYFARPAESN